MVHSIWVNTQYIFGPTLNIHIWTNKQYTYLDQLCFRPNASDNVHGPQLLELSSPLTHPRRPSSCGPSSCGPHLPVALTQRLLVVTHIPVALSDPWHFGSDPSPFGSDPTDPSPVDSAVPSSSSDSSMGMASTALSPSSLSTSLCTWVRLMFTTWVRKGQSIRTWVRKGQSIRTWDRKGQPIRSCVSQSEIGSERASQSEIGQKGQSIGTWVSQSEIGSKRRWSRSGPK